MSFVLDNSVALAWCFEDEQTPPIMALLDRLIEAGAFAPQIWRLEALNGLLSAERRRRIDAIQRRRLAAQLKGLPIEIDDETANHVWSSIADLAEAHRLSAYDAAYLELSLRLDLPLASSDAALVAAARTTGVEVLPTR